VAGARERTNRYGIAGAGRSDERRRRLPPRDGRAVDDLPAQTSVTRPHTTCATPIVQKNARLCPLRPGIEAAAAMLIAPEAMLAIAITVTIAAAFRSWSASVPSAGTSAGRKRSSLCSHRGCADITLPPSISTAGSSTPRSLRTERASVPGGSTARPTSRSCDIRHVGRTFSGAVRFPRCLRPGVAWRSRERFRRSILGIGGLRREGSGVSGGLSPNPTNT